jgi:hypothetical protein
MEQKFYGDYVQMVIITEGDHAIICVSLKHTLNSQHPGDIRAVQIHVQKTYPVAPLGQAQSEIHRGAGLAHAPLAAHHQKPVSDTLQLLLQPQFFRIRAGVGSFTPMTALTARTSAHQQLLLSQNTSVSLQTF